MQLSAAAHAPRLAALVKQGTAVEVKAIGEAKPRRGPHRHQAGLAAAKLATSEEFVCAEAAIAQVWSLAEHRWLRCGLDEHVSWVVEAACEEDV